MVAILRNDGAYIAGIKNNTRATVDHSAGSEFITNLYVVAILKLLAVCESGVVSLIKFARSAPYF